MDTKLFNPQIEKMVNFSMLYAIGRGGYRHGVDRFKEIKRDHYRNEPMWRGDILIWNDRYAIMENEFMFSEAEYENGRLVIKVSMINSSKAPLQYIPHYRYYREN